MVVIREDELHRACLVLFGPEVDISPEFLSYIQPSGIKSAFRRLARMTHPDALGGRCESFIEARQAYESLKRFIESRDKAMSKGRPMDNMSAGGNRHGWEYQRPGNGNHASSRRRETCGNFYRGPMPAKRLLLGEYLFYRGEVSWESLVKAIAWQRGQRPPIGAIARQWGWLGKDDLDRAQSGKAAGEPLGETLVRLGLLSRFQLHSMLMLQRRMQKPFGEYFVLHQHLSRGRLNHILHPEFLRHNARF